jgi:hypothetical protein
MKQSGTTLQFRVLYRQFLFRLMDVELLSSSAGGDASGLLGQCGALLISMSVLLSWFAMPVGGSIRRQGTAESLWAAERFLISLTMLVVGIFALLSWDSAFPDRRDVLVLSPLPIRARTLFAAKVAAAASVLGLVVAALHSLSGFAWPLALVPDDAGFLGTLRFAAAFWVVLTASGAFLYCLVLGLQGVAAQLPRRWYLRVSPALQIGIFMFLLGLFFFQPSASAWMPTYWFTGLLSELSGAFPAQSHAVMAPLAHRALASLPIAVTVAGGAFLLSYLRTLRKIVEEPDVVGGARTAIRLPRFGGAVRTALAHFVIRTLLRSRQHRVILSFYLGGGFAVAVVYLMGARDMMHLSWMDILRQVNFPILVATVVMLCAWWLGARTAFSLPLDLRANWVFRVTPPAGSRACLASVRRAMLVLSVLPVLAISAAVLLWFWPFAIVVKHLLLLGLLGSVLVDLSLKDFRKIPFTCSYLPGKSKVHMIFWLGVIPVVIAIHKTARLELEAMRDALSYGAMLAGVAAAAVGARWIANRNANRAETEMRFEDTPSDELVMLGLNG